MEKDFGSWFHHQYPNLQSAHLDFSSPRLNMEQQSSIDTYMNPHSNEVLLNENFPSTFSWKQESMASQPTEPRNWFYCLPRFRQALTPVLSNVPKDKLAPRTVDFHGGNENPNAITGIAQKRFLVFDQSGDQTTLVYSSANGSPVQCLDSCHPKPPLPYDIMKEDPEVKGNETSPFGHIFDDEYYGKNHRDDVEGEMHEDTEELNALLYSDDDSDYNEDDEVTSTDHSPSTMTARDLPEWFDKTGEEVASSAGSTKRHKLLNGCYDVKSHMDIATSAKARTCSSDLEDDAESSYGNGNNQVSGASDSLSCKKRPRKDQIHEIISILQTIIPGGKGKDSMIVIDEAIHYLRSLKVKAKALGLNTL